MAIIFLEKEQTFMLQGKNSSYVLSIDSNKTIGHLHWGGKITNSIDIPKSGTTGGLRTGEDDSQEYRAFGGGGGHFPGAPSRITPTLKVELPDGTRSAMLQYQSHKIDGDTLSIVTSDGFYPLKVTLFYRVLEEFDIIERWSVIENEGDGDVRLDSAYSASWHFPFKYNYRLTYLAGSSNGEFRKYQEKVLPGKRVIETRDGLSGPEATPFCMIDLGKATEDHGEVYFNSLIWSGNWQFIIEQDQDLRTILTGGINNFDFAYCLEPGQSYETPIFIGGYTNKGFGEVTRQFHRYERAEIIHPTEVNRILPVIYNTHGSLVNNVCEENVMREIDIAHEHGIELFVLDAGWTGYDEIGSPKNGGESHRIGFGTWEVNKKRFPNGLKPLADKLHSYGMKFGLWIEPETVHIENKIAKEHPEWLIGYDNREAEITEWFRCYSLNMANDEACDYVTEVMLNLVRENGIDYIKNDFNRRVPQMNSRGVDPKHSRETSDKYVRNMWRCYSRLKEEFPDLIFENSAGGGRRTDLGMLRFSGRMHRSDNQDPLDSIKMHEGMTMLLPSKFAGGACFISDEYSERINHRKTTMEYQAHVAMLSGVSVSLKLAELSPERRAELAHLLELNREIRRTVQFGDFYRLVSANEAPLAIYEFLEQDKSRAVAFILGQNLLFGMVPERLCPKDLDPDKHYRVTGHGTFYKKVNGKETISRTYDYGEFTGRGLMNVGVRFDLFGHATSQIITIDEIK